MLSYRNTLILALLCLIGMIACNQLPDNPLNPTDEIDIESLIIPDGFNFATSQEYILVVEVADNFDEPLHRVPLFIMDGLPTDSGKVIAKGASDIQGTFTINFTLPSRADSVVIHTNFIGLPGWHKIALSQSPMFYQIGGTKPGDGVVEEPDPDGFGPEIIRKTDIFKEKYVYLGSYNNQGVPNYLEPQDDHITQDLLDLVNTSLPEARPVPEFNPQYIAEDINTDTRLQALADIWITFIHEGAGWKNALGYYTYDLNNPPTSPDQIDSLFIIFPNVSLTGAGGGLNSGNKVYLGRFPANTGLGWFLVPQGWNASGQDVNDRAETKFSKKIFNTFTDEASRSHVVLLKDDARELLILGMEDITRPDGDNDFNDAIFYVTASPYTAIITDDVAETQNAPGNDRDEDGVNDPNDDYPDDPERAFNQYTPGEDVFGTLVFEDLWPFKGDYDMNDMVIDYNFNYISNTSNRVVDLEATFRLRAMGAGFRNGFGFEIDIPPAQIASVTGTQLSENYIQLANNGVEDNQSKAVFIVFDNGYNIMSPQAGQFVNTVSASPFITPVEISFSISFTEPILKTELGNAPFNPFIMSNLRRGYEIHLPDYRPTDLAADSLFRTGNDDTDFLGETKYYKTANNLPWAIHFTESFDYPEEKAVITLAYDKFADWSQSGGTSFIDWYSNVSYRVPSRIYQK